MHKKWIVADADKEKASVLSEKLNIDPFIAFLLVSRGIDDELSASDFLSDGCKLCSAFSITDMDRAADRINKAVDEGEKICIYGDYDCDGVTATALLYLFLESMGADVTYFIPDRITDGYGMNKASVDEIKRRGTDLIITVDNGISALEEAEYIYSLGMQLIVTDHHQVGDTLPRAEAVVNPHRDSSGFKDYAGVGVAFKLACAVYGGDVQELLEQYADLAAIGTIGDVVALKNENRTLVRAGLELINRNERIGIAALKKAASSQDILKSSDVAFQLCPRINAAGRMGDASLAVELLICDDYEQALYMAEQLNEANNDRHCAEDAIIKDIENDIALNREIIGDSVIVIAKKGYYKGVLGIVASHITEAYGKPSIIMSIDENSVATGSARSIEGFNIYKAISSCSDMLLHYGGHPLAAGLGLEAERISDFRKRINDYARTACCVMPMQTLRLDCKLSPHYLTVDLADSLSALEPYGAENSQPVFGLFNLTLRSVSPIGSGKHIRLEAEKKGRAVRIVKFKTAPEDFPYHIGEKLDFAVKLSKNIYKGREFLSVQAVDVRKSAVNDDKYFLEKTDYEMFLKGNAPKTSLYPSRDDCALVYKFLRKNNGWNYSADDLYFELSQAVTYGQLCYALCAFEEAGLITGTASSITLTPASGKTDLDNTNVLKELKGRL